MTALFNDLLSWVSDRGSERRDGRRPCGDVRPAHVDKDAQAAAAAEIRQDAEDERGHAVCADTAGPSIYCLMVLLDVWFV